MNCSPRNRWGRSSPHARAIKKSSSAANTMAHHWGANSPADCPKSRSGGRARSLPVIAPAAPVGPVAVTRFFLGGASALARPAAGSTFPRTSGADWAFGAAPSLGSGATSDAGAGVAATASSLGSGATSGAGAGVAATASSLGSGVTSGAGAGVGVRTCNALGREGFGRSNSRSGRDRE